MVFFAGDLAHWQRFAHRRRDRTSAEALPGYRPLLIVEDGEIVPMERVRSRGRPIDRLFEFLAEFADFEQATVLHGRPADDARMLFDQLKEAFPEKRLEIRPYGTVLATHLGPSAFGVGVYEGL
jgi:fatty acid-binding protein DegV